ncbi:hypothetical protein [Myxococcus sp. RHSTA-1-4]|uniref:hypothetical protein n=1 Tax=Myxococcus sp. RHSTA-1-4 TaxID=2874601 RepID=UPI001CBFA056|nr:hypothetical protein [Myxococcus sp. RHSTA-1-4]MBZ4417629.1 hypothetical protein [Myxococcus sp. RHSTA-1-4]
MFPRGLLPSLVLLLSSPAVAEDGVTVRVRCTEKCTVVLDGKRGLRVTDSTWEFKGIAPGSRRVEATGVLGRPFVAGFADIPDVAEASVFLGGNKRIVVERRSTPPPGTPEWAEGEGAKSRTETGAGEKSVAIVRCPEDCTVLLDGRRGLRRDDRTWEFKDVEPGRRRVEAHGGLLNQRLFLGYVEIPAGTEATLYGDSKGNVKLTNHRSVSAAEKARAEAGRKVESHLNVRCQKPCTVSLDGTRRGASNTTSVVLTDVKPGAHDLEVVFTIGKTRRRATLEVPARSEMFVTVSEGGGIQVTNTKALGSAP